MLVSTVQSAIAPTASSSCTGLPENSDRCSTQDAARIAERCAAAITAHADATVTEDLFGFLSEDSPVGKKH